jgi:hypothetical protein
MVAEASPARGLCGTIPRMKRTLSPRPSPAAQSKPSVPASSSPASPGSAPGAPKFTPRGAKKDRVLVAVTDGKIDFEAMSPEASKTLNELLHRPDVQAQFGIGPLTEKFDPAHCKRLYQALGKLMETGTRFALHWPEAAAQKLLYSDREQEELAGPTAKVLDQYGNRFMQENQSVIALVLVFAAITQHKFQEAARILAAAKINTDAPSPTARPANAVPISRPIATGGP